MKNQSVTFFSNFEIFRFFSRLTPKYAYSQDITSVERATQETDFSIKLGVVLIYFYSEESYWNEQKIQMSRSFNDSSVPPNFPTRPFLMLYLKIKGRRIPKQQLGWVYSRHQGNGCVFLGQFFFQKKAICLLPPPKQMSSLTISNKMIFFQNQCTGLGAIIAPSKGLEQVLLGFDS